MVLAAGLAAVSHASAAELPSGKYKEWSVEKEIFVPMRDGVHLSTDVLLPKGASGKLPTVLVRTPDDKAGDFMARQKWREFWLKQGYAFVVQNERGRYFSEGSFKNYLQGASTDGYDTVEWIVKQPWSNGKVGSIGCSSSADTQWPMAASNPPGLAAIIPAASGTAVGNIPGNDTRGAFYRGGVPYVFSGWAGWYADVASEHLLLPPHSTQEDRIRLHDAYSLKQKTLLDLSDLNTLMHLPSGDLLHSVGAPLGAWAWNKYITWMPGDAGWNEVEHIGAGAKPQVPALHLNTWHDVAIGETTRLFKYLEDLGTPNQYLIIGAGPHGSTMTELYSSLSMSDLKAIAEWKADLKVSDLHFLDLSDLKFGDLNIGDGRYRGVDYGYVKLFLEWFGFWLTGNQNYVTNMPKVQLYVMGQGWISGDRWPLKETEFTSYYLGGNPGRDTGTEGGELSTQLPGRDGEHRFSYDPGAPTPSRGGGCCDPGQALDQRPVEARRDVLVYSTPPLDKAVTMAGPIEIVLYVSSSAKDTDFIVKLVDVYPDGKAINLNDDAFRVRYREGFDKKVLMEPGQVYKICLPNIVTAIRFPKGHRIRFDISSSSFPLYERNLNTGGNNFDETTWVIAENSIHYGPQYPSHVVLPVLRN